MILPALFPPIICIILLSVAIEDLKFAGRKVGILISKIAKEMRGQQDIKQFSLHQLKSPLNLNQFGILIPDFQTIGSIMAILLNFLVLFMQFELKEKFGISL